MKIPKYRGVDSNNDKWLFILIDFCLMSHLLPQLIFFSLFSSIYLRSILFSSRIYQLLSFESLIFFESYWKKHIIIGDFNHSPLCFVLFTYYSHYYYSLLLVLLHLHISSRSPLKRNYNNLIKTRFNGHNVVISHSEWLSIELSGKLCSYLDG